MSIGFRCRACAANRFLASLLGVVAMAAQAPAADFFLTIGGGYEPGGNQLSIETNVQFYQRLLASQRPDGPSHDLYFADGADELRDVQYRDAEAEQACPPARRMLSEILGEADAVGLRYRDHQVAGVAGPTDRNLIARR